MRRILFALSAALFASAASAAEPTDGMTKGTPEVKSISAIAFGPGGVLFIGDPTTATITAVSTDDTKASGKDDVSVEKIDSKLGSLVGGMAADVTINDVKVNPASGNIYLAVTKKGTGGGSIIAKLARDGKLSEFALKDVTHSTVKIANPAKNRTETITSMSYVEGKLVVAGLSNEEFASTLRTIPFPFKEADKGASIEIYHGAHGKLETNSPIRTFTPYKIGGADFLLAAYTCTPLVKIPLSDLKTGTKVKGTTIAELGNQNRPLDMISYTKDKKSYLLMANSARGIMKIDLADAGEAKGIDSKVTGTSGLKYETIKELKGVMQLDKLDEARAILLVQAEDKTYTLKSVPLP